jgi:hypothetical protein
MCFSASFGLSQKPGEWVFSSSILSSSLLLSTSKMPPQRLPALCQFFYLIDDDHFAKFSGKNTIFTQTTDDRRLRTDVK